MIVGEQGIVITDNRVKLWTVEDNIFEQVLALGEADFLQVRTDLSVDLGKTPVYGCGRQREGLLCAD